MIKRFNKISIIKIVYSFLVISVLLILLSFSLSNVKVQDNLNENNTLITNQYSLRDEQFILDDYQDVTGLCWAFTTKKVIESTLAKKTHEA